MDTSKVLASGRDIRQWEVCDPERMMEMSPAAIEYALIAAKADIMSLAKRLHDVRIIAEEGMCHGLLADDKCREILELIAKKF